nr:zinc finger, CCHC-type, retrotransposon Gag domain protein [Tanacetum cinerariifolium]
VQKALQTLLPQIRAEIREEFRTSSGPSNAVGNPPPFFPRAKQERLKREYHSIRQTNTETSTEFIQRFLRLAGFFRAAAVANAARNYEILHERDDDDAERPDKRQKSGIPVIDVTREIGVSSLTDLPILVFSSPRVPLRATPTRFALRVDTDTQESVVELL